ncbi:hypothetical protein GO988_16815 [Hymenobacter sp. HMF4947]|uniref:Uncharacterized protein n=1 Tax=Hymenobacter ginkgonis TaxID=2682976 RepID=A0A7K1THW2_9BACT|nr:hypothetical protein [Hymenobacter ginkgonis]MVN77994.1 hypothetical protein [Hymenobacter ginkgonis]
MKSLLKISLLFALIIAGRYMQLTTPAAVAGLTKSPVVLFSPASTMTLTHYMGMQKAPVEAARQRKQVAATWY